MDKDQRIQGLLEANSRYVENNRKLQAGLRRARDKFSFYAESHKAKAERWQNDLKGTQGADGQAILQSSIRDTMEKAKANEAEVNFIDQLLTETAPI